MTELATPFGYEMLGQQCLPSRSREERVFRSRPKGVASRSEEHTSELQSHSDLVCRLLLEKKNGTPTARALTIPRRVPPHILPVAVLAELTQLAVNLVYAIDAA